MIYKVNCRAPATRKYTETTLRPCGSVTLFIAFYHFSNLQVAPYNKRCPPQAVPSLVCVSSHEVERAEKRRRRNAETGQLVKAETKGPAHQKSKPRENPHCQGPVRVLRRLHSPQDSPRGITLQ